MQFPHEQYSGGGGAGPTSLEYASDTDALHSPAGSSIVGGPVGSGAASGSHRRMNGNVSSSSIVSREVELSENSRTPDLLKKALSPEYHIRHYIRLDGRFGGKWSVIGRLVISRKNGGNH